MTREDGVTIARIATTGSRSRGRPAPAGAWPCC